MIVLDASAAVEMVLRLPGESFVFDLLERADSVHSPHLIDIEVAHVVRRLFHAGQIDAARAEVALTSLVELPITRHPHVPLISRVWSLRANLSAYDATYVALAEAVGGALLTRDARLARSAPPGLTVITVPAGSPPPRR